MTILSCRTFIRRLSSNDLAAKQSSAATRNGALYSRVVFEWRGCRSKSEKSRGGKSLQLFPPLSSRFFGYIFPPPKTALFGERTLSGTTVPHGAQRRRKGVNFRGKGEPRSRVTRRGKRGKQQRSVLGFPLKQAKNEKADAACAASALFLFVFRFSLIALKHPTTNPSPRQPRPTWCSNGGKLPYI